VLREGLNNDPDSLPIADELAVVLMLHGRDAEALATLDLALEKHPDDQPTQLLCLRILVSATPQGSRAGSQAASDLSKSVGGSISQRNPRIAGSGLSAARTHLERCIALNPSYYQAIMSWNHSGKDWRPARRKLEFEKAIAMGDSEPEVQYDLAKFSSALAMMPELGKSCAFTSN